ncbi:hypothetical protein A4H97_27020 [Niastella yeongjuensis]|uniref:DUF4302 domain-containing protein n=1 Tax=Niastella yeongjuensis TaxID=354355 RepID=A0A1V9F0I1_9BACT|nr:DUF4302 domain-containing protein [Niastella yeongjuensis]OQP51857.1 hypothetical protein A4H97_27020 [Niastella yeongjuensis]SEP44218.1 protein of unknown function [Niastella yeongjuensis]
MNKKLLYYILALSLVASCKREEDHVFDKSPDDRLNETLKTYQTAMTSSQYGWNGNLHTADGTLYRFYFSFNDSNRVQMLGDFDSTSGSLLAESSYRLKALQQPSLIFDTYSYLHQLSDPDGSVNGGPDGVGLKADFEFAIDSVSADSISLTGRFNGSRLTMKKATQADRAIWTSKQVGNGVVNFKNYWKFLSYWKRLNYRNVDYELQFDSSVKKVTVSWGTGNQAQSATREYYFWANGVYFLDPIVNGSVSIPGFSITGFTNDVLAANQLMNVTVNGTPSTIKGAAGSNVVPINPDVKNAVVRWRSQAQSTGNYWISFNGFHKNGVEDAFDINSLRNDSALFYYLLYSPNSRGSDGFLNIYLDTASNPPGLIAINGSWAKRISDNAGLTTITEDSVYSEFPWPASGPAADTRNQLFSGTGRYYFVQSSAISYDMVSKDDPTTWITWWWIW